LFINARQGEVAAADHHWLACDQPHYLNYLRVKS